MIDTAEDRIPWGSSQGGLGLLLGWWPKCKGWKAVGWGSQLKMVLRHYRPERSLGVVQVISSLSKY